jgi:hypothetical protein
MQKVLLSIVSPFLSAARRIALSLPDHTGSIQMLSLCQSTITLYCEHNGKRTNICKALLKGWRKPVAFLRLTKSVGAKRTREIGVHVALGATRSDVLQLICRQSLVLVGSGMLAGLVLSFLRCNHLLSFWFQE